ncbi:MAG: serine hydrolase [Solirubrobacteraceae bacterium]
MLASAALVLLPPAALAAAPSRALTTAQGIALARDYARARKGVVAFAVLDPQGRLRGLNRTVAFPSASVMKAMLLVARLRELDHRPLTRAERRVLGPMVTVSDNAAAHSVYRRVGDRGLRRLGRAAGMRYLQTFRGDPFGTRITAADQVRFFLRIDRLVPPAHRAYARRLLASIVPFERWGIAPVAHDRGLKILFKGGWRPGIVHQVALLERGRRRVALAVLTSGQSQSYGEATLEGIARRVLR